VRQTRKACWDQPYVDSHVIPNFSIGPNSRGSVTASAANARQPISSRRVSTAHSGSVDGLLVRRALRQVLVRGSALPIRECTAGSDDGGVVGAEHPQLLIGQLGASVASVPHRVGPTPELSWTWLGS